MRTKNIHQRLSPPMMRRRPFQSWFRRGISAGTRFSLEADIFHNNGAVFRHVIFMTDHFRNGTSARDEDERRDRNHAVHGSATKPKSGKSRKGFWRTYRENS